MKIKKSKFVIGALMSAASVGLVGSIASTFAWYTYNTKAPVSFHGIAGGKTESLQLKLDTTYTTDADWVTSIAGSELNAAAVAAGQCGTDGTTLGPVSPKDPTSITGATDEFIGMPIWLDNEIGNAGVELPDETLAYFQQKISVRVANPADATEFLEQDIYLSFLEVKVTSFLVDGEGNTISVSGADMSNAIRMHISDGDNEVLIAPGSADDRTTQLYGPLDLNNDGYADTGILKSDGTYRPYIPEYDDPDDQVQIVYGDDSLADEEALGTDSVLATFTAGKHDTGTGTLITTTPANEDGIELTITIWLEGWDEDRNATQQFKDASDSPIGDSGEGKGAIDANIGYAFDLGMIFQCDALPLE